MEWKKNKSRMKVKVKNEQGDEEEFETIEPYVHWAYRENAVEQLELPSFPTPLRFNTSFINFLNDEGFFKMPEVFKDQIPSEEQTKGKKKVPPKTASKRLNASVAGGVLTRLPKGSRNPKKPTEWKSGAIAGSLPTVPDDTIIVGIIDTGISLAHRNFRDGEGKTRFVASWQQGAQFKARGKQLPMGSEIYESEINEALMKHSVGRSLNNWIDEDAFNRDLELVDPSDPFGQRDLDLAAPHGTNVLDLAAGHLPRDNATEEIRRQRIIAVNLPAQDAHGTAGNFLAYLADQALRRIVFLADALWKKNFKGREDTAPFKGYPIVINFSYGMQAGPKDGTMVFERAVQDAILKSRPTDMNSPIRLAMPAGNEAQFRGAASMVLGEEGKKHDVTTYPSKNSIKLPWRLQPDDYTSNYVEIWTESPIRDDEVYAPAIAETLLKHLKLSVTPPGEAPLEISNLELDRHYDLGPKGKPFARIYCDSQPKTETDTKRLRFLICTAPTASNEGRDAKGSVAPAGAWEIKLEYEGEPVDFRFHIQSDQSAVRTSNRAARSYFDHENYETHVLSQGLYEKHALHGAVRDTYHYNPEKGFSSAENWNEYGPVQRLRTHNALASANADEYLVCIASHVGLTGRPAPYSSPTDGDPLDKFGTRTAMTVSFIGDSAPNHFGLLAAGAKNGATVAYRGTSMSSALATRCIIDGFMEADWTADDPTFIGSEPWLRDQTGKRRNAGKSVVIPREDHWGKEMSWKGSRLVKLGRERLDAPESFKRNRVSRLGGV